MPDFILERTFVGNVVGVDEAGRGPWAGDVVAAAVMFPNLYIPENIAACIDDSKKLSHDKREKAFALLMEHEIPYGVGVASVAEIDKYNILQATFMAMQRAVSVIKEPIAMALVDGNRKPPFACPVTTVIKGDSKSFSIAAASIIAKVTRDRMMCELAQKYPEYGWDKNAGYGTALHQAALKQYGITPHHRRSYAPIRKLIEVAM